MKKIIYILLLFHSSICFSQKDSIKHKWELGIQISSVEKRTQYENSLFEYNTSNITKGTWRDKSLSYGLFSTLSLTENCFLRFNIGITTIHIISHSDSRDEIGYGQCIPCIVGEEEIKQSRYYFNPAFGLKLDKKLFTFYGGLELPITIHGNYLYSAKETDYDINSSVTGKIDYLTYAPGGFSLGIGGFAGFDFYLVKNFSFGATFSSALLYSKLGGRIVTTYNQTVPVSGTGTSSYLFKTQGMNYSGGKISFNVTYQFKFKTKN